MKTRNVLIWAIAFAACAFAGPVPASDTDPLSPETIKADFAELYQRLQDSHYDLYARRPKADYDALYARMLPAFSRPLTRPEVEVEFQRFAAYGRVAHARVDFPTATFNAYRDAGGGVFPLWLKVVAGLTYVAADRSGVDGLAPGTQLLAVDGIAIDEWMSRLGRNVSADDRYLRDTLLETDVPAMVWLEFPGQKTFKVTVRSTDGREKVVDVPVRTRAEITQARAQQPPTLELSPLERVHRILPEGIGYLRPGVFFEADPQAPNPWDPTAFGTFIDTAFREFNKAGVRAVLIDLRDNPGGDNSFSDLMVQWFATKPFQFASRFEIKVSDATVASNAARLALPGSGEASKSLAAAYAGHPPGDKVAYAIPVVQPRQGEHYDGKVFALINRNSFSNTVVVAAMVQDYGFGKVLGEPTSDYATTYGAMEQFKLSRTGITVGYPKALIVRPNGSLQSAGVVPDIEIPAPVVETPDDPVLRSALSIVHTTLSDSP